MIDRNVLTQSSAAMGGLTAEGNGHVRVSDVPPAEAAGASCSWTSTAP